MLLPSGENDAKALLLEPEVTTWKPVPSALRMPISAPPFTASLGFLPPAAKSRNAVKPPTPTTICLPSGDHCGARTMSLRVSMALSALPSSTMRAPNCDPEATFMGSFRATEKIRGNDAYHPDDEAGPEISGEMRDREM